MAAQMRGNPQSALPPDRTSSTRLRPSAACVGTELRIVADRFRAGEFHAALLTAMHLLDRKPVPILCASPTYLARAELTNAERILIALVDGTTSLEDLIEASGLGLLEGIDAFSELLDVGVVAFDPEDADAPITLSPGRTG